MLGVSDISENRSNNGRVFRNVPTVHMTVGDVDKDGIDELVVTAGLSNTYDDISNQETQIFVYDYIVDNKPEVE